MSAINRLQVKRDGNTFFVCLDDFVDLQESPAYFYDADSWQVDTIKTWHGVSRNPLIHLPTIELLRVYNHLQIAADRDAFRDSTQIV